MPAFPAVSSTTAAPRVADRRRGRGTRRPGLGVLAAIGLGGAVGSAARYGTASAAPTAAGQFPWTTWWINLTGALVLAVVVTLVIERWPPTRYVRSFVGIGICGAFTTWSTFMTETALLLRDDRVGLAALYVLLSLAGGLAATYAGIWLGRTWPTERRRSPGTSTPPAS